MNRAYSILDIKSVQEDERVIEGIASTPSVDRMGDIVEPLGAQFTLPMPLLWQHRADQPVGQVEFAKPNKDGIPFRARIAKIDQPGELQQLVDKAWQAVKAKLVRAVSIGFSIDAYEILKSGGWRINSWEWLELSLVTIPANSEATISSVKSIDAELLAATGQKPNGKERTVKAGVTATPSTHVVKAKEAKPMAKKTIAEQIAGFEASRQAKSARMLEIMETSGEKGETLSAEQKEEYDGLADDLKAIDEHLVRLRETEKLTLQRAVAVTASSVEEASTVRSAVAERPIRIVVAEQKKLEPSLVFARYVRAMAMAKGQFATAIDIVKSNERWMAESPELVEVIRTAVNAGTATDATWAGPLVNYQVLASAFAEYLRPLTIIGRIPGLTRVPFNVKIQRQTGASSVNWVGEGKVKPISSLAFDLISLTWAKIAGIIVLTDELIRLSNPAADTLVRNDLAAAIVQFMDANFVDPTKAATDISPASITNGVTPITATAATPAALRDDLITLIQQFLSNNLSLSNCVWIMSQQMAFAISAMVTTLGVSSFPGMDAAATGDGRLLGIPVVASEGVPATGGSPTDGSLIILAKANEILVADDGQVTIDASREASLQMDTTPDSPNTASTVSISMFQQNMTAIRAERMINWAKRRSTAVSMIQNAKYTA